MRSARDTKTAGTRDSFWVDTAAHLRTERLSSDITTDVLILGAGMTGIATGYLLAQARIPSIVVDDGPVGSGETGRTTAHVTNALDFGYSKIAKFHGLKKARLALESQIAAIDLIESLVRNEKIDCHFQRLNAYLFLAEGDSTDTLKEELKILSKIGYEEAGYEKRAPVGSFDTGPCIRFSRQARFHATRYLVALTRAYQKAGGRIFTQTHVQKIGPGEAMTLERRKIFARHMVIATHSPVAGANIFLKQAAYRTYVIAGAVPKGTVPDALYWDTGDPYHYVRLEPLDGSSDLMIVGGEDHKTGQPETQHYEEPFHRLESWTRERFPMMRTVEYKWSGQVIEPVDALAFIGRVPHQNGLYLATGYSGNGMTYSHTAAMLLRDLISGRKSLWTDLYDPARKNIRSLRDFLQENMNAFKHFTGDRLRAPDVPTSRRLAPGEGAIIQQNHEKIAAYRDEKGELHTYSAVCPHLHCIVQWNGAEKTFDCPCHGSRFTCEGKVLNGPSIRDLEPRHVREKKAA